MEDQSRLHHWFYIQWGWNCATGYMCGWKVVSLWYAICQAKGWFQIDCVARCRSQLGPYTESTTAATNATTTITGQKDESSMATIKSPYEDALPMPKIVKINGSKPIQQTNMRSNSQFENSLPNLNSIVSTRAADYAADLNQKRRSQNEKTAIITNLNGKTPV